MQKARSNLAIPTILFVFFHNWVVVLPSQKIVEPVGTSPEVST
jgi:hypothetical protein